MKKTILGNKTTKQIISIALRYLLIWLIAVAIINIAYSFNMNVPRTRNIINSNEELVNKIDILGSKLERINDNINTLSRRDSNTYRQVLGLESNTKKSQLTLQAKTQQQLYSDRYSKTIEQAWDNINSTKISLYERSVSLDTINNVALEHINLTRFIPAIWPIDINGFRNKIDPFGMRMHPIHKRWIMHNGLDFSCVRNTAVIAPADGIVKSVKTGWNGGYGNTVEINHGLGYVTLYAHLNKSLVSRGDVVRRGDKIALIGSTGSSTGPHLHYEVRYKGTPVDPANYLSRDQSHEDTASMLENARLHVFYSGDN